MNKWIVEGYAKLNLSLEVTGRTDHGYHTMEMVMQSIDWSDTVTLSPAKEGITLQCDHPDVPCDATNIAYRCAEAFFKATGCSPQGVHIAIQKRIPMQAGMAGGSADGAAVLAGLNAMYETHLSTEQLCEIGVKIGADIPFCLWGGTMEAKGIGERLSPLSDLPSCTLAVIKPPIGISTKEAFARLDARGFLPPTHLNTMISALEGSSLQEIGKALYNDFADDALPPEIRETEEYLRQAGAYGAVMTGSGSAVFGLFAEDRAAQRALDSFPHIDWEKRLCRPTRQGVLVKKAEELE